MIHVDHAIDSLESVDSLVRAGHDLGTDHRPKGGFEQDLVDQRALSTPRDAGHTDDPAEGNGRVDRLEIVRRGPLDDHRVLRIKRASSRGYLDASSAREVHAGKRVFGGFDFRRRSLRDHPAAVLTRAGADVDDVIGLPNHIFVVFDHKHGVADVGEMAKRRDKPIVVSLVQADGRLVKHVADADQSGSDLRGEADSLRLAAGEGSTPSIEREIIKADRSKEAQSGPDLAENRRRDRFALGVELEIIEEFERPFDREVGHLRDVERLPGAIDLDASGRGLEATAPAVRALGSGHVAVHPLSNELTFAGLVSPPQVGEHALELESEGLGVLVGDTVKELVKDLLRHGGDGSLRIHVEGLDEFPNQSSVIDVHPAAVLPPGLDGPFLERPGPVRHHEFLVEFVDRSQARTGGACSVG